MNKQRKVLITITYNEMGIIIDTKAEEVAQSNLQPTCNQLATDCISRRAAIDAIMGQPPEPAIPISWLEKEIERLESYRNSFAVLDAMQLKVLIKRWRGEAE